MDTVIRSSIESFVWCFPVARVGSNDNVYWTCWHQVCINSGSGF